MVKSIETELNQGGVALSSVIGSLSLITGICVLNFMCRAIFSPLMPTIEDDLGIGHAEAGYLFLLISAGYFVAMAGSGFFSSRFTHRKTIVFSAIALGVVIFVVSFSRTLVGIGVGLALVGLAAGVYLPSGISTLMGLVRTRDWGKAFGVHELGPSISFLLAPLVCEALLRWFSWRYVLVCLGIGCVLLGLSYARFGKGGRFPGEAPRSKTLRILFAEPGFWVMVVVFGMGISGTLGVYSMLPLYLVAAQGMGGTRANYLVALSRVSGLGIAFVSGIATDRWGPKITLAGVLLVTGLITLLLGVAPVPWLVVLIFLQPLMAHCFFPPAFAVLSRVGPPKVRNITVSFTVPAAFLLGGGAVPAGIGLLADNGFFFLGFILVGGLIMSGFFLLHFIKLWDE